MKEDHMLNGQLKPGYNLQISSNNQYIVNYSLHQTTADTATLQEHTELYKQQYNATPKIITADAGYGSEENYQYLKDNNIEAFVNYNYFDKQQSENYYKKHPFAAEQLYYNKEKDCYYCPMGQAMNWAGSYQKQTSKGSGKR